MSALGAFVRRDWLAARSYRFAFALELAGLALGLLLATCLGRLVDGTKIATDDLDAGYFAFAVVGLAAVRVVQAAVGGVAGRLRRDQLAGTLEAVLATPAPRAVVLLGSAAYDVLRAIAAAVALVGVAVVVFGFRPVITPASVAAVAIACAGLLAVAVAIGVVLAAVTLVVKETTALIALATTGLALLCGVYYPVAVLPEGLRTVGEAIPLTWGLDALRAAMLKGTFSGALLLALAGAALVAIPCALLAFTAALDRCRRTGALAQY